MTAGSQWASGSIVAPLRPTWDRYRHLCSLPLTLMRSLQYQRIRGLVLDGRTLDAGGGHAFDYYPLIRVTGHVDSVNLNAQRRPSVLADLNVSWPWATASYDHVISFNTLEHLREDQHAIREILRVLKPGGSFHLLVPFAVPRARRSRRLSPPHGFLVGRVRSAGGPIASLTVEPLVWSAVSSACAQFNWFRGRRGRLLKRALLLPAVVAQRRTPGARMSEAQTEKAAPHALAYYIWGTR